MSQVDVAPVLPQAVLVRFPRFDTDSGTGVFGGSYYAVTTALTSIPEFAGLKSNSGTQLLHVGQPANYLGGVLQNGAALAAYANQLATDWYRHQLSPLDEVFDGVVPYAPEGLSDVIEWDALPGKVSTHVRRPVWDPGVIDLAKPLLAMAASSGGGGGGTMGNWAISVAHAYKGFLTPATAVPHIVATPLFFETVHYVYGPGVTGTPMSTSPLTVTGVGPNATRPGTIVLVYGRTAWDIQATVGGPRLDDCDENELYPTFNGRPGTINGSGFGDDFRALFNVLPASVGGDLPQQVFGGYVFGSPETVSIGLSAFQFSATGQTHYAEKHSLVVVVFSPVIATVNPQQLLDQGGQLLTDQAGNVLTNNGV